MNTKDKVKKYQEIRQNSTEYGEAVQQSAVDYFQQLNDLIKFSNSLPIEISYRKHAIQQLISDIVQSTDRLQYELNLLNADCSIQIHGLIIADKIRNKNEEKHNERKSNAKLARRANFIRKQSDIKESSDRRQDERVRRKNR